MNQRSERNGQRNRRNRKPRAVDGLVALAALGIAVGVGVPALGGADDATLTQILPWLSGSSQTVDVAQTQIGAKLEALTVRDPAERTPSYSRRKFGEAWADEDGNGCDTRNDILARDLSRIQFKRGTSNCVVNSGTLAEPYGGTVMQFQHGEDTSPLVQIDHVVALGDAWRSGAWQWDRSQRQKFANDPANLLAVDGKLNEDKASSSADKWLPPNEDFHCEYVSRQIEVKYAWKLSVTPAERDAMAEVLSTCPEN